VALDADNSEQPSLDQLDALLEEASALAEDLSLEIAGDDPFLGITDPDQADDGSAEHDTAIPGVDAQLESVDELIVEAQSALGAEAPAISEGEASSSADDIPDFTQDTASPESGASEKASLDEPAPEASVEAIPDFMQEFTQPDADESASGQAEPDAEALSTSVDDIPDFMTDLATPDSAQATSQDAPTSVAVDSSPKLGRVGTSFENVAAAPASEVEPVASLGSILSRLPKWIPIHLVQRIPVAKIRAMSLALAIKVVEKGVDLLEVADRPTQRIGFKPRQLIGLVAISTLGTALVVFVISMF